MVEPLPVVIDRIIRSRRKTLALQILDDATLVVRAPFYVNDETILKFVARHEKWIRRQRQLISKRKLRTVPKEYVNGEGFLYLGNSYRLWIVDDQAIPLRFDNGFYLARKAQPRAKEIFTNWYKKMAATKLSERVAHYARSTGIQYRKVRLTSAVKRLGSCSPDGTLNFSWRLIMAPLRVIDYVVVHELVHVEEKNHSPRFWEKVKVILPDYAPAREWLKNNWHRLKL